MKKNAATVFLVLGACWILCAGLRADETREAAAAGAAEAWLALVDEGSYSESWKAAAPYFRTAVPEPGWIQSLEAFRKPLGKVLSRKRVSASFATTLPGVPDGQYVVIQYETSYENKRSAVETVTPMRDPDGKWRVSGYYIK